MQTPRILGLVGCSLVLTVAGASRAEEPAGPVARPHQAAQSSNSASSGAKEASRSPRAWLHATVGGPQLVFGIGADVLVYEGAFVGAQANLFTPHSDYGHIFYAARAGYALDLGWLSIAPFLAAGHVDARRTDTETWVEGNQSVLAPAAGLDVMWTYGHLRLGAQWFVTTVSVEEHLRSNPAERIERSFVLHTTSAVVGLAF